MDDQFVTIEIPEPRNQPATSLSVLLGRRFSPQQQILLYDADEWEEFILEWVHSQRAKYSDVRRMGGARDRGIDVAGFTDSMGLDGVWDGFQCKHFAAPVPPSKATPEIAKILWHSFEGHYVAPRKYYFVAPKGCSTELKNLLSSPSTLLQYIREHWDRQCAQELVRGNTIRLQGSFEQYVTGFDFSTFEELGALAIIDGHRSTPYHAARFGGGLPPRSRVESPPSEIHAGESRYIQQLFEAYSERLRQEIAGLDALEPWGDFISHFHLQREYFYHAESLRNFARDAVPPGTFEELQNEMYDGVVTIEMSNHPDGMTRMDAVTQEATAVQITSNALISVLKVKDRKGICHQLANQDRLHWRKR